MHISSRVLGVLVGVALLCGALGCGIGPHKDRLYVSEWKNKKDHPIRLDANWTYPGEHWEHAVYVDSTRTRIAEEE